MLEKILGAVLQKYAGKYLEGIEQNNLKIEFFSGNVVIENVRIKPDVVNMLELPVKLLFSHIGRLQVKIPVTKIGSSPVEVSLDGIYIILIPKAQNEWEFRDYRDLDVKKELIDQFAQNCFQKLLQAQTKQNEAGYMQNLQLKIIDNIQLNVKSIHIRYEQQSFSAGLSLDQLEMFTTDYNGNKTYIDRTQEDQKNKTPIRKKMIIKNLGFYQNSQDTSYFLPEKNQTLKKMNEIKREQDTPFSINYIFSISMEAKLLQQQKADFSEPETEMKIDLDRINFSLDNQQLQQIIEIAEFFNQFNSKLLQVKKSKKNLDEQTQLNYETIFKDLYVKVLEDKNQSYTCLNNDERNQIEEIILALEIENLLESTKSVCLQIEKQKKIKELGSIKLKQQQGFFGGWFGGAKTNEEDLVSQEERQELNDFFDNNIASQLDYSKIKRPFDYVWFVLQFNLKGGSILLYKIFNQEKEGIEFSYEDLGGILQLREKNQTVQLTLSSFKLDMVNLSEKNYRRINFLKPSEEVDKNFLHFIFEAFPLQDPNIDKSVILKIGSIKLQYNPTFIDRLVKFFEVRLKDEQLQQATWDKVEGQIEQSIDQMNKQIISPSIIKLDISLRSPVIILPLAHNYPDPQIWVINLGNLYLKTNDSKIKNFQDIYEINLNDIKFEYFPALSCYEQNLKFLSHPLEKEIANLFDNFSIQVSITVDKNIQSEGPSVLIDGLIQKFNLNLCPNIYQKILNINKCFQLEERGELEVERKKLMESAVKVGQLYIRGKQIKTWKKKYAIISKGYLYIFNNIKDLNAEKYYWVKNSLVIQLNEDEAEIKNAFNIKNKYTNIYLACEKPENTNSWIQKIQELNTKD